MPKRERLLYAAAGFALAASACNVRWDDADRLRSNEPAPPRPNGLLGNVRVSYACDPAEDACDMTAPDFEDPIAVGSPLSLQYTAITTGSKATGGSAVRAEPPSGRVRSASEGIATTREAKSEGRVLFLAISNTGQLVDYAPYTFAPIAALAIELSNRDGSFAAPPLATRSIVEHELDIGLPPLAVGEALKLRAYPIANDGGVLAGRLAYASSVDDGAVVEVENARTRMPKIRALAPGRAEIVLRAGAFTARLRVEVGS